MLTILADSFLTATRQDRSSKSHKDWDSPKYWKRPAKDRTREVYWRGDYDD